ncbi:class I SAM-dependent methyltransferase [Aquella oligotrophica]|uniref:Methyltransferase type 11 domain-containing protein n=1 Tax=Aquella oligotrophica TaxID=2067065 RepID=A0A2I7N789_9NEIS|nr:class I SAM-dependent methyltransferase [Aquella oligotrophica]AUR52312.1 hypothetical protein CUN60_08390 [Aquella oligotrophica]
MGTNYSHTYDIYDKSELENKVSKIKSRLSATKSFASSLSLETLFELLDGLQGFALGRFLIMNGGINGYWTDYVINFPREQVNSLSFVEKIILNSYVMLATHNRHQIFKKENQKAVADNAVLAAIPSGVMSELLDLDFSCVKNCNIFAVDLDKNAHLDSKNKYPSLFESLSIQQKVEDALLLDYQEQFDLISSNGLTIYIEDDELVKQIFHNFYRALKPGAKLVTSYLTYPQKYTEKTEQSYLVDFEKLNLEIAVMIDILQVKWSAYRTTEQMLLLLKTAGFRDIRIIPDDRNIFPTVVALK